MVGPLVSIGLAVRNEERQIHATLDSLLAQTYTNFELIVSDNASDDSTHQICTSYAAKDARVRVLRNQTNLGITKNCNIVIREARGQLFALAAGHDCYHPRWLETMVAALNQDPDAILAWPMTVRISDTGERYDMPSPRFDSTGMDARSRIRALRTAAGYGDMIYGLFRIDALRRVGGFRRLLLPDVFLLWALALQGGFKQVPEELWYRRYIGLFSVERQKRNIFGGRPPWYAHVPWPLVNTVCLAWLTVLRPRAGGLRSRGLGLVLSWRFLRKWYYKTRSSPPLGRYFWFPQDAWRWVKTGLARVGWIRAAYRWVPRRLR